jgi:hypothetical protein
MVSEAPVLEVDVRKDGDMVETAVTPVTPSTLTVDVTSESGIGSADVVLVGGKWPETILFRVHTKGLENFTMGYGTTAVSVSVTSSGMVLNSVMQDGQEKPIGEESQFFMPVTVADDYFEIEAPADFHAGEYDAFAISWIDFYR